MSHFDVQGSAKPDRLTPTQIRAARAMLGWSMVALAKAARVSVSTVKRAEDEGPQPVSDAILAAIRDALETEGVRFLADDGEGLGVRLRARQVPIRGQSPTFPSPEP